MENLWRFSVCSPGKAQIPGSNSCNFCHGRPGSVTGAKETELKQENWSRRGREWDNYGKRENSGRGTALHPIMEQVDWELGRKMNLEVRNPDGSPGKFRELGWDGKEERPPGKMLGSLTSSAPGENYLKITIMRKISGIHLAQAGSKEKSPWPAGVNP